MTRLMTAHFDRLAQIPASDAPVPSALRLEAVHVQALARDVARLVRGQECDRVGLVLCLAQPAERHADAERRGIAHELALPPRLGAARRLGHAGVLPEIRDCRAR